MAERIINITLSANGAAKVEGELARTANAVSKLNAANENSIKRLKGLLGEESAIGNTMKMLRGAGAFAAVGMGAQMFERLGTAFKDAADASRANGNSFGTFITKLAEGVPVVGSLVKGLRDMADAYTGLSAAQKAMADGLPEFQKRMSEARQRAFGQEDAQTKLKRRGEDLATGVEAMVPGNAYSALRDAQKQRRTAQTRENEDAMTAILRQYDPAIAALGEKMKGIRVPEARIVTGAFGRGPITENQSEIDAARNARNAISQKIAEQEQLRAKAIAEAKGNTATAVGQLDKTDKEELAVKEAEWRKAWNARIRTLIDTGPGMVNDFLKGAAGKFGGTFAAVAAGNVAQGKSVLAEQIRQLAGMPDQASQEQARRLSEIENAKERAKQLDAIIGNTTLDPAVRAQARAARAGLAADAARRIVGSPDLSPAGMAGMFESRFGGGVQQAFKETNLDNTQQRVADESAKVAAELAKVGPTIGELRDALKAFLAAFGKEQGDGDWVIN